MFGAGWSSDVRYKVYPGKSDLPPDLHQAYMARRIQVAQDMWRLMGVAREDPAARARALLENFRFWGAPVGIIVTVDRGGDRNAWGHVGMLLQSVALLAVHHGLASAMLEVRSLLRPKRPDFIESHGLSTVSNCLSSGGCWSLWHDFRAYIYIYNSP